MTQDEPIVIIADLIESRRLARAARRDVQVRLQKVLEGLNERFAGSQLAGFRITLGDEVETALRDPEPIPEILWTLETSFAMRIAVSRGAIFTDLDLEVGSLDGPAFHRARALLERSLRGRADGPSFTGFGPLRDRVLTTLACTLTDLRRGWTPRQLEIARMLRAGKSTTTIASEEGQSVQNIGKHARSLRWPLHQEVERALATMLSRPLRDDEASGEENQVP